MMLVLMLLLMKMMLTVMTLMLVMVVMIGNHRTKAVVLHDVAGHLSKFSQISFPSIYRNISHLKKFVLFQYLSCVFIWILCDYGIFSIGVTSIFYSSKDIDADNDENIEYNISK